MSGTTFPHFLGLGAITCQVPKIHFFPLKKTLIHWGCLLKFSESQLGWRWGFGAKALDEQVGGCKFDPCIPQDKQGTLAVASGCRTANPYPPLPDFAFRGFMFGMLIYL